MSKKPPTYLPWVEEVETAARQASDSVPEWAHRRHHPAPVGSTELVFSATQPGHPTVTQSKPEETK